MTHVKENIVHTKSIMRKIEEIYDLSYMKA